MNFSIVLSSYEFVFKDQNQKPICSRKRDFIPLSLKANRYLVNRLKGGIMKIKGYTKTLWIKILVVGVSLLLPLMASAASVSTEDLINADKNKSEWLMYGRTYNNQRFSPLTQINPSNVADLRPVWAFSVGNLDGLEGTPLVHDGVIYITAAYAHVFALDARNGRMLWHYAPKYPEGLGTVLCCGPINRGVAIKGDLIYVLTLDARLVALDKNTGAVVWEKTIGDWQEGITATGAPLVVKDHVIVGIAGGEYGVRGYIRSYNAKTGDLEWNTFTIPGPGEPGHETWPGDTWMHGGGTTWQTGSYDPELNQLYWGTGNGGPWNSDLRKGDNLWISSLLSLDPDTGKINWGYQYTPNEGWDYDGNNAPILADIIMDGKPVKAAIQSNRNGFLYVLNRINGEFIYAVPTIEGINWAKGLDPKTGRPIVNEAMRPLSNGKTVEPIVPGLEGGTNWFPMAYNPDLGYVFFATNQWAMGLTAHPASEVKYEKGKVYMGVDYQMYRQGPTIGHLKAFDVVKKEFVWDMPSPLFLFAGVLATKSGLVFTGDQFGFFMALDAKSGKVLWKFQTGSGINASPITYELDGKQYVAILSGLGGDPSFYIQSPKGGMLWVFGLENLPLDVAGSGNWQPQPVENALKEYPPK
jgi:alcohol dehydrogenase (cytochrome c)